MRTVIASCSSVAGSNEESSRIRWLRSSLWWSVCWMQSVNFSLVILVDHHSLILILLNCYIPPTTQPPQLVAWLRPNHSFIHSSIHSPAAPPPMTTTTWSQLQSRGLSTAAPPPSTRTPATEEEEVAMENLRLKIPTTVRADSRLSTEQAITFITYKLQQQ